MQFERALDEFLAGPWGRVTETREAALGMCQRTTLALLAHLERTGTPGTFTLWRFESARADFGRGPEDHGNHWVPEIRAGEIVDLTAAQFDGTPGHRRGALDEERRRWKHTLKVDPDNDWDAIARVGVRPNWRDLLDAGPPGDVPSWPYPRDQLSDDSPWRHPLG
jgi:hypothetical protein